MLQPVHIFVLVAILVLVISITIDRCINMYALFALKSFSAKREQGLSIVRRYVESARHLDTNNGDVILYANTVGTCFLPRNHSSIQSIVQMLVAKRHIESVKLKMMLQPVHTFSLVKH